ncbi:MAG: hypothetical protein GEU90_08035 [Gemmatimonas sp.]|nr:hypothetical protein [Gemmatimonas sp.]
MCLLNIHLMVCSLRPRSSSTGFRGRSQGGGSMPLYEYACLSCGDRFEALLRGAQAAARCPKCASSELERLVSVPRVQSASTRALTMKAARARDRQQGEERTRAQREYELSHDD